MDHKKRMLTLMVAILAIYLIALTTGILFFVFLFKGEFIRAAIVLLIELSLFFIGRELRRMYF